MRGAIIKQIKAILLKYPKLCAKPKLATHEHMKEIKKYKDFVSSN